MSELKSNYSNDDNVVIPQEVEPLIKDNSKSYDMLLASNEEVTSLKDSALKVLDFEN